MCSFLWTVCNDEIFWNFWVYYFDTITNKLLNHCNPFLLYYKTQIPWPYYLRSWHLPFRASSFFHIALLTIPDKRWPFSSSKYPIKKDLSSLSTQWPQFSISHRAQMLVWNCITSFIIPCCIYWVSWALTSAERQLAGSMKPQFISLLVLFFSTLLES